MTWRSLGAITKIIEHKNTKESKQRVKTVRGMRDVFPPDSRHMAFLRSQGEAVAELAGYTPVTTPIIEQVT